MKEEMLVLAKAKTEVSTKYGCSICVAGITKEGEFRRIYPVPHSSFLSNPFSKRDWIEYEIRDADNTDGRKESRKIYHESIQKIRKESSETIYSLLKKHSKPLEDLRSKYREDKTSLGIVKVKELLDFNISTKRNDKYKSDMPIEPIDIKGHYHWKCTNPECREHHTTILDSEFMGLYLSLKQANLDSTQVHLKLYDKFFDWMKTREVFFLLGNHYIHRQSWMIISIFYPEYKGECLDSFFGHASNYQEA